MRLSPVIRLYISNVIITGILYTVISFSFGFFIGKEFQLVPWLVSVLSFGFVLGLVNTLVQTRPIGTMARRPLTKEDLKLTQRRSIHLRLSPQEVLAVLNDAGIFKERKARFINQSITIATSTSWASWGEQVTLTWAESSDGYMYEIESRPNIKFSRMDGGKNFANVEKIVAALSGETVFFAT